MRKARLRLGVSSCLLGERVRYDGRHKRNTFLVEVLGPQVEWVPVCPEMEIGLGVPREPIHLVLRSGEIRLVGIESNRDWTEEMRSFARKKVRALRDLDGYVLKSNSPSCGAGSVAVEGGAGSSGAFAGSLARELPSLPVVEETDLRNRRGRLHFVERALAHRAARQLLERDWTKRQLQRHFDRHELQIVAHSAAARKTIAQIIQEADVRERAETASEFLREFSRALAQPVSQQRHVGALRRALNRLHSRLSREAHASLASDIDRYGRGSIPLEEVRTRVSEAANSAAEPILMEQTYLLAEEMGVLPI